jgi:hypothetical protein
VISGHSHAGFPLRLACSRRSRNSSLLVSTTARLFGIFELSAAAAKSTSIDGRDLKDTAVTKPSEQRFSCN